MTNSELIHHFYESFARADVENMVSCYHPDIIFKDPAFGELKGENAKEMWRLLVKKSKGQIKITYGQVEAGAKSGNKRMAYYKNGK